MARESLALPSEATREWAWGDSTGRGVRVCVIDSGVDTTHGLLGGGIATFAVQSADGEGPGRWAVVEDEAGDVAGHGTACCGIIRTMAPDCELTSVRILGKKLQASGEALLAAVEWAIRQRFTVVNLSLSTQRQAFKERLHDIADEAHFNGVTLVSSAHNSPVTSYPWRFPSVLSVGAHGRPEPEYIEANPTPPVDFFAAGVNVPAAWPGGRFKRVSGNSFATPHIAGLCARILARHPGFGTAQLKHVLAAVADNIDEGAENGERQPRFRRPGE